MIKRCNVYYRCFVKVSGVKILPPSSPGGMIQEKGKARKKGSEAKKKGKGRTTGREENGKRRKK